MKLPPLLFVLGYAGLIPFFAGPALLAFVPGALPEGLAPEAIDAAWLSYCALIASFMAGTFWGMALWTAEGPEGRIGMALSIALMLAVWIATLLPMRAEMAALAGVFVLLALAELWRERVLDPLSGYFRLRLTLTSGVLLALGWRYAIGLPGA